MNNTIHVCVKPVSAGIALNRFTVKVRHRKEIMKNRALAAILIIAVSAVMVAPGRAQAGDSEWATAGKILAGLTALHVLTGTSGHGGGHYAYSHEYRDIEAEERANLHARYQHRQHYRHQRHYRPTYRHHYRQRHAYHDEGRRHYGGTHEWDSGNRSHRYQCRGYRKH